MIRARPRLGALALAIVAALAIGGCGGEDEQTSTGTTSTATAPPAATTSPSGSQRSAPAAQGRADQAPSNKGSGDAQPNRGSSRAARSRGAPKQGSKAPAPGVPVTKGGDNGLATYGLESGSDERAEAAAFVQAYLDARAAGEWEKACSYITAEHRRSFERLASGRGCGSAMAAFSSDPAARADEARIDVLSLRVEKKSAALIYGRPDGHVYVMGIIREGGERKLTTTLPLQLDD